MADIESLLDLIEELDQADKNGEESCTPREHWAECLAALDPEELAVLEAMAPDELGDFLFDGPDHHPGASILITGRVEDPLSIISAKIDQVLENIGKRVLRDIEFAERLHRMEAKALGPAIGPSEIMCWHYFLDAVTPEDKVALAACTDEDLENMLLSPENEYRGERNEFYTRIRVALASVEGWG